MIKLEKINSIIDKIINEMPSLKDKLEKLRPRRTAFARLRKKDITQEEYLQAIKNICNEIYSIISKKYPFSLTQSESLNYRLSSAIKTFYNFHYAISFSQNKAKFYPISLDNETAESIYKNELLNIIQEHLTTEEDYDKLINEKIALYQERIEFYKKALNETELSPYYGTPEFMYKHAAYIIECAKKLPFKTENLDKTLSEMKEFTEKYPFTETKHFPQSYPYFNKTYKSAYERFEEKYLTIINFENALMPKIAEIWQRYLTNPNNHNNGSFKYIIHTFSGALVPPERMTKACCCLATEKLLTTPYGNCGLIYDFTYDSVETICYEDAKSWQLNKKEFVERNLPITWQLTPSGVFYEEPQISKLILPSELEKIGIANNLVHNPELLNYSVLYAYTEILLNSKAKVIGAFYTDNCPNIEEISAYAKKYNLPLVHLSLSELRKRAGLNPIPTQLELSKEADNTLKH